MIPPGFIKNITKEDRDKIKEATKKFRRSLLCGTIYSILKDVYTSCIFYNVEDSDAFINVFNRPLSLSTYDFVYECSEIIFKPNLSTFPQRLIWGTRVGITSHLLNDSIVVPLKYLNGKDNYYYLKKLPLELIHSISYNFIRRESESFLPDQSKIGGEFARFILKNEISSLFSKNEISTAITSFLSNKNPSGSLKTYLYFLPNSIFDTSLLYLSKQILRPLMDK